MKLHVPETVADAAAAVDAASQVRIRGGQSKQRHVDEVAKGVVVDTSALSGIVDYEPEEYTITAKAGTSIRDLQSVLSAQGQYLPFDPPWVDQNATLGGTVASGVSGAGRVRFGSLRDFVLGIQFIAADGQVLYGGGRVVKNAAGFDLPKLFVGTYGRLGLITEMTLKVFPYPASQMTLAMDLDAVEQAIELLETFARNAFEMDALEYRPGTQSGGRVHVRLAGPDDAMQRHRDRIASMVRCDMTLEASTSYWQELREFSWADSNQGILKVSTTLDHVAAVVDWCRGQGVNCHIGGAGQVAYLAIDPGFDEGSLRSLLISLETSAIWVRDFEARQGRYHVGDRLGESRSRRLWDGVKHTLDSTNKFGDWSE